MSRNTIPLNIFVAGGSGTIGVPLVRALVGAGHHVTALTRSTAKIRELEALGAKAAVADALDRDALIAVLTAAHPTHVIHQLTALPKDAPRRARDLEATNRLRIDGTRNLLDAAIAAGARRLIVGSFAPLSPRGPAERSPEDRGAAAVRSMETQVLEASARGAVEGVVLRYGLFYGPDAPSTVAMIEMVRKRRLPVVRGDAGLLPVIHIDDAVDATVRALDAAPAGAVYEIVDDRPVSMTDIVQAIAEYTGARAPLRVPAWVPRLVAPYMARVTAVRMSLSNLRATADLGWRPRYPTMRDGLARMLRQAA
jgi:nucleoside-diphosphate-sugar epimerase